MTTLTFTMASVLGLLLGTAPCLRSQTLARISGRVYDATTNAPLPGARISSVSPSTNGGAPVVAFTTAGDDGTYSLNVAPGRHVFCVDAGKIYLDPCRWFSGSTAIIAGAGSHLDLPLRKGVLVLARLSDPNGVAQAVRAGNLLLAQVSAPLVKATITDRSGVTREMWPTQPGNRVSEFALAVPPGQPFTVTVVSSHLSLADASGTPLLQNTFGAAFTSPAADASYVAPSFMGHRIGPDVPSKVFNFVVTGRVKSRV